MSRHAITVVMPAFNEADGIEDVLAEILDEAERAAVEIAAVTVVDDGSTDATAEAVKRVAARDGRVSVISHRHNRGFGAAVRTSLAAVNTRYALMVPSDGEWDPAELAAFGEAAQRGARLAIGERDVRASEYSAVRRTASALFSLAVRALFNVRMPDLTWVQMYDLERIDWTSPESETATYPVQIVLLDVSRHGADPEAVHTVRSAMRNRSHGASKVWRPKPALRMGMDLLSFWWRFRVKKQTA